MRALSAREKKLAQFLADGENQTDAHENAGWKRNSGNAAEKCKDPRILAERDRNLAARERVSGEATAVAIEKLAITKEAVLGELARIGFANMLDYIRIGEDGQPYTDFSALTRDQAAAIGEITVETRVEHDIDEEGERRPVQVRKVRFKLADKRGPLNDLGKHLGLFRGPGELPAEDGKPIDITDIEAARRIAFLFNQATRKG